MGEATHLFEHRDLMLHIVPAAMLMQMILQGRFFTNYQAMNLMTSSKQWRRTPAETRQENKLITTLQTGYQATKSMPSSKVRTTHWLTVDMMKAHPTRTGSFLETEFCSLLVDFMGSIIHFSCSSIV